MKQFKIKILPTGGFDFTQKVNIHAEHCVIFNEAYIFTNIRTDTIAHRYNSQNISNIVCSYPVKNTIIEEIVELKSEETNELSN